ncbi:hypothetical protein Rin_00008490 [Candidatus Regiella insecticola 5.15]|uniref:Uncharacterized protein n=1 Tax=Candidatus Regiella insecticola 5.15 TaxID=1005043 RepID=G2GYI8_9ENTR|nr:hypothetical protein Rin_00008490 [Candidatus Regiella insecticola 5.15]
MRIYLHVSFLSNGAALLVPRAFMYLAQLKTGKMAAILI